MTMARELPRFLDYLLAKSAAQGAGGKTESLAEHTYSVLEKLAATIRLRPALPQEVGVPRLWHILFWTAFLHDFGKAAQSFQAQLKSRGAPKWSHRHEVLSLTFVDWVASAFEPEEQRWLVAAIVSHHRDAPEIGQLYNIVARAESDFGKELDSKTTGDLWRWLAGYPTAWIESLGLGDCGIVLPTLPPQGDAVRAVVQDTPDRVRIWLNVYQRWFEKEVTRAEDLQVIIGTILLRGHLIASDHMASAHVGDLPNPQLPGPDQICVKLKLHELYQHQTECRDVRGSAVLMAPTGSGKTEAALLWAVSQYPSRLYYTLPFQASMNAMEKRLAEDERDEQGNITREAPFKGQAGLEHSRSTLAYYRRLFFENENADPQELTRAAKWLNDLAHLNYYPVRVLSPYQLLKAPYRLKGYESTLSDCYGAAFVFDEIHTYEPGRLAKILALVKYLRVNYHATFLVMSATLPNLLRERLRDTLGPYALVTASDELYRRFRRHKLVLQDGDLLSEENLTLIADAARRGQAVLVCCNTVSRAQQAWRALREQLREQAIRVELLHGRFNGKDRLKKEQMVQDATGARSTACQAIVLVATQVVEVSLDIDLEVIYTDPAPLEALLQRFGRINRRRLKDCAPVYVFREPVPDKPRPYEPGLVHAALDVLEAHDSERIDEANISMWLDQIYRRPEIAEPWVETFRREYAEFTDTAIATLRAFQSDDQLEELFYHAFDSVDVLPEEMYNQYLDARQVSPLEASQLLVPLHYTLFGRLKGEGRGYLDEEGKLRLAKVHYDSEVGLDLSRDLREPQEDQ